MTADRRRLRGAERRPLKGYAPLVVLVAALIAMVALVPSRVPDDIASATGAGPNRWSLSDGSAPIMKMNSVMPMLVVMITRVITPSEAVCSALHRTNE